MDALAQYRDDGVIAAGLSRVARQPVPVAATAAAALVLVVTFVVDGPRTGAVSVLGVAVFVVLASVGQSRAAPSPIAWLVPPMLRAAEYGAIVFLAWRADGNAPAAAFVLLGAVAFHQYDVDHRLRIRGVPPPRMVGQIGLGWDGRLLVMTAAAIVGVFAPVAAVVALLFGTVALGENVVVWRHRAGRPPADPAAPAAGK
ncbi:MAG: hypothetical protein KY433_01405 [Actinobacteria bacterium]|nr:hypothetical protein [Actinomycetota bacterium]